MTWLGADRFLECLDGFTVTLEPFIAVADHHPGIGVAGINRDGESVMRERLSGVVGEQFIALLDHLIRPRPRVADITARRSGRRLLLAFRPGDVCDERGQTSD